eukprot:381367_1
MNWILTFSLCLSLQFLAVTIVSGASSSYHEELVAGNAVFNAASRSSSTQFNPPQDGIISGVRLTHASGGVRCNNNGLTNWGCNHGTATMMTMFMEVTDTINFYGETMFPTAETDGIDFSGVTHIYGTGCPNPLPPGMDYMFYEIAGSSHSSTDLTFRNPMYKISTTDLFMLVFTASYVECNDVDDLGTATAQVRFQYEYNCDELGTLKHINWDHLLNTNNDTLHNKNLPYSSINISVDINTLETTFDIDLEYLGTSTATFGNNELSLGTTYVIDFEPFDDYYHSLAEPGSCSNRIFNTNNTQYWEYSKYPWFDGELGSNEFLAYPPATNYWTISAPDGDFSCDLINYLSTFSFTDLLNCKNYAGERLINITSSVDMLILSGSIYVSVVSPYSDNTIITSPYRQFNVISQSFSIAINKFIDDVSSTELGELFIMTIQGIILNEASNTLQITLYTEIVNYLLFDSALLVYTPLSLVSASNNIQLLSSSNTAECLTASSAYRCGQRWRLYIYDYTEQCPMDFSGDYNIQFETACNDGINSTFNNSQICQTFLQSNGGKNVLLSTTLHFKDENCDNLVWNTAFNNGANSINFYGDSTFNSLQS